MKKLSISALLLAALLSTAQTTKRPDNWFNLDPATDKVNGVSTEKTYNDLLKNKKSTTVIVGVLDSGVDFDHEDLKSVMWTNPGEIPGNGIDDDKNGYIDDIHGWNFLGGKDGKNVSDDNLEMTRLMRKLKPKYDGKTAADFTTKADKEEFAFYQVLKEDYTKTKEKYESNYNQYNTLVTSLTAVITKVKAEQNLEKVTLNDIEKFSSTDKTELRGKAIATQILKNNPGANLEEITASIKEGVDQFKSLVEYGLNMDFNPRSIIGDDYNNSTERNYGNADCNGPDSFHGTHVAGIIAAARKNGVGMDGIAADVRIMAVRCVPGGDEHDKDVANAIRYAVDNGATILNMSFGKKYAWDKKVVDDAVKYAESKGVLIVHAAGNDNTDIDKVTHYPCKKYATGGTAANFMDVGALSWQPDEKIVASFSNYGKKTVDIFSPGVDIYSTAPKNEYKDASGTSMASPVTAGVAAVLKSYYPTLTAEQIKKILIKSSLKTYKGKKVIKPGTEDEMIKFEKLGGNAGVINLYEAVKMAEVFTKSKT
jgi:subtilisin family serine protease